MEYGFSPAPSVDVDADDFDNMTDEEMERYFANYVPLSNLPTPPPAKEVPVSIPLPRSTANTTLATNTAHAATITPDPADAAQHQSSELEVYAEHLCKLVPHNAARAPCTVTIKWFLERLNLPVEVVAFAACLLDALSQCFASSWRAACLVPSALPNAVFTLREPQSTGPEVIVLAALSLAHGFLSDSERSTKLWAGVCDYLFSVREIEATKRCLLQDIDYGLARISNDIVASMLRDIYRAMGSFSRKPVAGARETLAFEKEERKYPRLHLDWRGTAVWEYGMQTPEPSPRGNSPALC